MTMRPPQQGQMLALHLRNHALTPLGLARDSHSLVGCQVVEQGRKQQRHGDFRLVDVDGKANITWPAAAIF
jgi:hypothetical protein